MTEKNANYWADEIRRAEKDHEARGFYEVGEQSSKMYEAKLELDGASRRMSIWWQVVQTIIPAYYTRKPRVEASLRKKQGPKAATLAARLAEGAAQYSIDEALDFDSVAMRALVQFLLVGRTSAWVRYEADIEEREVEFALLQTPEGLIDGKGALFSGDVSALTPGPNGLLMGREISKVKTAERAVIDIPYWKDYLHSVARADGEITWKARRAYLSRAEAVAKFGKQSGIDLQFDVFPEEQSDEIRRLSGDAREVEGKAELWEIWDKESKRVYWFSNRGQKSILMDSEPPIEFPDFFPCVDISQNISIESAVGVSDFAELKDLLLECERLTTRIHATIQAIRANIGADAAIAEDLEKMMTGDLRVEPLKVLSKSYSESIWVYPVEPYIKSLEVLVTTREQILGKIFEATGASDILRGMTNATETATAQALKASFSNVRFGLRQRLVIDFFGRIIGKLAGVIGKYFDEERLIEISNVDVSQVDPLTMAQAFEIVRDDKKRCYRLQISSDSMTALDQNADRQQRVDFLQSVGSYFQQLEGIVTTHPSMAMPAFKLLEFVMRTYKGGKELEDTFEQMFGQIVMELQQKAQQPKQDPGAADAQVRLQIAQMDMQAKQAQLQLEQVKIQSDMERASVEAQVKMRTLEIDSMRANIEMQRQQMESALKVEELKLAQAKLIQDAEVKGAELLTKQKEAGQKAEIEAVNAAVDARMREVETALEAQKLVFEKQRVQLEMYEKLLEEKRLNLQQLGKPKTGKITRDEKGNATVSIE